MVWITEHEMLLTIVYYHVLNNIITYDQQDTLIGCYTSACIMHNVLCKGICSIYSICDFKSTSVFQLQ